MKGWSVKWVSDNQLDGHHEHFICNLKLPRPSYYSGYSQVLFATRKEARDFVLREYGYIKDRKDLRGEPHGWKMPKVVRVKLTITEIPK